jgi:hypothetical protein
MNSLFPLAAIGAAFIVIKQSTLFWFEEELQRIEWITEEKGGPKILRLTS